MPILDKGRYRARFAADQADVVAAQQLRFRVFFGHDGGVDCDRFDDACTHVLIEETATGKLIGCFRLLPLQNGTEIDRSYSAQFYGLSALKTFRGRMVELGRFCIDPKVFDSDALRIAWAAMTRYVDENAVEMLFGCSSFKGTDVDHYLEAFTILKDRHLAPQRWLPQVKAASVYCFARKLQSRSPDMRLAMQSMPPLLRTYLAMGGWVSDHAVVDRELNTLHVFTGLEIDAIPAVRKRLLRAVAQ